MKAKNLILKCYAKEEPNGSWFAICLDLNLSAQADSFKQVKVKLHNIIYDYVQEALTTDKEYITDLLPRRAPFYFYIQYYLMNIHYFAKKVHAKLFNDFIPLVPADR